MGAFGVVSGAFRDANDVFSWVSGVRSRSWVSEPVFPEGKWTALGEVPEQVEGTFAVAEVGGVPDGFGDEVFGSADGFDGGVAKDEVAEEGGGKGAAGAVGGGGIEVLAGEPVEISRGEAEEVGGLGLVAGRGYDVEVGVSGG